MIDLGFGVGPGGTPVGPDIQPTLASLLRESVRDTIVAIELEPSITQLGFLATVGLSNTYEIECPAFEPFLSGIRPGVYRPVIGVREDATELTARVSAADVDDNPGSWFWDEEDEVLYVHTTTGDSPDTFSLVQAFVRLHMATAGIVLDRNDSPAQGRYYWPWVIGESPTTQDSLTGDLFGISSTTGGELRLANGHGWWNTVLAADGRWNWKNKIVRARLGGRFGGVSLVDSAYEPMATVLVDDYAADDIAASLTLKPLKRLLDVDVPKTPLFEGDWPDLHPDERGKRIPYRYGRATIAPLLADTATSEGRWLVADPAFQTLHAVHNVWAVSRSDQSETLLALTTDYTVNLAACTVTVVNATYTWEDYSLRVDMTGKEDADGNPINTFAGIVYDLLKSAAAATDDLIDHDSFVEASAEAPEPLSVQLETQRSLNSVLSSAEADQPSLEKSSLGLLTQTAGGLWHLRVRSAVHTEGVLTLEAAEFAEFKPETTLESAFASTRVTYARVGETWQEVIKTDERTRHQLSLAPGKPSVQETATLDTYLTTEDHANTLASRFQLIAGGVRRTVAFMERGARLYNAKVGDVVHVNYSPAPAAAGHLLNEPMEIIALERRIAPAVEIRGVLRTVRGLGNRTFVAAPDTAAADWTTADETERKIYGFAADDSGFIEPGEPLTKDIKVAA